MIAIPFMPHLDSVHSINKGVIDFVFSDLIFSFAYGWLCIVLASCSGAPKTIFGRTLNYGGTITYGFYMFHMPVILAIFQIAIRIPAIWNNDVAFNWFVYATGFMASLVISAVSYEFYEAKVLKLRKHFLNNKRKSPESSPKIATEQMALAGASKS
jgi:peptidoglycan/LPS O-acetylase OafA/YrhL